MNVIRHVHAVVKNKSRISLVVIHGCHMGVFQNEGPFQIP